MKPRSLTLHQRLTQAWSRIPGRERLMLTLLYFEGLTPTEAARALGCSVREVERAVESRLEKLFGLAAAATETRRVAREPRRKAA